MSKTRIPLHPTLSYDREFTARLIDIQVASFNRFVAEGIKEELLSISPISSSNKKMSFEFLGDYTLDTPRQPYYTCKDQESTYSASLTAKVRLINHDTGEVREDNVFMGDIPIITEFGTFLINGAERIVVSQFVRSPGVYYRKKITNTTVQLFSYVSTIVSNRGSWLEFELDYKRNLTICINKTKRIPMIIFMIALGFTCEFIRERTQNNAIVIYNIGLIEDALTEEEALVEVYRRLRPGDPVTLDGAKAMMHALFFDESKYDLGAVGRYKINSRFGTDSQSSVLTQDDIWNVFQELLVLV